MQKPNTFLGAGPCVVTRWLDPLLKCGRRRLMLLLALHLFNAPANASEAEFKIACQLDLTNTPVVPTSDEAKLQRFCDQHHVTLELLAPARGALDYRFRPGYRAKTAELKMCKSIQAGTNAGLEACGPQLFPSYADWYAEKQRLAQKGYAVSNAPNEYLVTNQKGELFFSDYDLLGVWDAAGENVYDEFMRLELNHLLERKLIMHGPLAIYEHRAKVGLKLPVRLFTAGHPPVTVHTIPELKAQQTERRIRWVW